jgi:nicotinamidase-related amidase
MSAVEAPARPRSDVRDQLADHLLTPQNAALIVIDYQPSQFAAIRSLDQELLTKNIVSTVKVARLFDLPIVHSTVNVSSGLQQPTVQPLAELLDGHPPIDRTTINTWEDPNFVAAVRATGRRKLVMCALWTGMCLAFPTPVTDAVGGTSAEAHRAALERVVRAGAQPITWVSLAGELQRDWARLDTVPRLVEVVINERPRPRRT